MDPFARRRLGRSKIEVTRLGFGTAPLSGFRGAIPEDEAIGCAVVSYDAGVNLFDTSPYYGFGRAELRLGAALRDMPRSSYVLSTKVGRYMRPIRQGEVIEGLRPGGLPFVQTFDYSYDGTMRSIEQSHLRLGIARIDILLIHDVDGHTHKNPADVDRYFGQAMEGAYRALDELRRAGTIGAIGVGLNRAEESARFLKAGDFDCLLLAGRYTLLDQRGLDEVLPLCEKKGVGVILGGPYNSGILATEPKPGASYDYASAPPEIIEKARRISEICRRHGVSLQAAALQFPLFHAAVAAIIPGAMARSEVRQNIRYMRELPPTDLWAELKREKLLAVEAPVPSG
jgi:D-threo-aldose 1-dehydrogenase